MFMSRAIRSVFELGAGDLVFRFETKNLVLFSELRKGLNREVKEKSFLVYVLVYLCLLVKHYWGIPFKSGFLGDD